MLQQVGHDGMAQRTGKGLEVPCSTSGLSTRGSHQADVPAVAVDRQNAAGLGRLAQTRVGLHPDDRPAARGDGGPVEAARIDHARVETLLGEAGESELGKPPGQAGGPAGGIDDQVGAQFRFHAVGITQAHAPDGMAVAEQSNGLGARTHGDPRVFEDLLPDDEVRQVPGRGDHVVGGALPAAVPPLGRVDHHVGRHRYAVSARGHQPVDAAR